MATSSENTRRRYSVACMYAMDAIKWYCAVAPTDNAPYALVNEVLVWSSGGKATWESCQKLATLVRFRLRIIEEMLPHLGSPPFGALAASASALRTVLCLVDTSEENVLADTWNGLDTTKRVMGQFYKSGVVEGAANFLQKSGSRAGL